MKNEMKTVAFYNKCFVDIQQENERLVEEEC